MLHTAAYLATAVDECAGLANWLHMLGFRGHWGTKSRTFSVTLGQLRAERQTWRRRRSDPADSAAQLVDQDDADEETTLVIKRWSYAGAGYHTSGDAALAAAQAREYADLIREEVAFIQCHQDIRHAA